MKLISRSVTPKYSLSAILSLIGFSKLSPPSPFSALPAVMLFEASPKAISERTSYLRVRLEFHRYPQVIAGHCNERAFGPPWSFTSTSACSWLGHSVSGRIPLTIVALLRLAFASAADLKSLASLVTFTRRTILQKVPYHTLMCSMCL